MVSSTHQLFLLLGLSTHVHSFRLITSTTGGNTYNDVVGDYQQDGTDVGTDQAVTHWYDPNAGTYDELGDKTSTLPGANGAIWGWWSRWGTSGSAEDPLRKMSYVFACSSSGTVTISFDVYFCIESWDTDATWFNYDRVSLHDGQNIIQADYSTSWTTYSNVNINNGNGICDNPVRMKSFTDTFSTGGYQDGATSVTTGLPPDLVTISINHNMEGYSRSSNPNTRNIVGFNNMKFTCTQVVTDAPTHSPTGLTANPTKAPTQDPTKSPTLFPTKSPINIPTRNPTTAQPTAPPTTYAPSKDPSKTPTVSPTRMPTMDPTDNPTEKPSPVPSANNNNNGIPTIVPSVNNLAQTLGGTGVCDGDFLTCNLQFLVVAIVLVIVCCLYWILGSVWYKRRQNNRPLPPHLMINKETEMQGPTQHATANKWKSDWELEKEAKAAQANGGGGGGDAVMTM